MTEPMAPATIRRLMRAPSTTEDVDAERVREAEARGREAGHLIVEILTLASDDGRRLDASERERLVLSLALLAGIR